MARILCIEDDADIQQIMGRVLFAEGYEVHYAWNGREGYEKLLSVHPDLILLDLMTPVMNGVEFLKKCQENRQLRDIPVVIVTGFGDEADMLKYAMVALGAKYYLRKPVDFKELAGCVKQLLSQYPRAEGGGASPKPQELRKGVVRADSRLLTVWVNDRLVATLSPKEFALLELLMKSPGPMRKEELLKELGYGAAQGNAFKQILHRLRHGLGPSEGRRIRTGPAGYELLG